MNSSSAVRRLAGSLVGLLLLTAMHGIVTAAELRVVVSIKPIHSILAGLMQGADEPVLLIDGERTPYGYQLSDAQRRQLADADLVVWVGPELERFLIEPLKTPSAGTRILTLLDDPGLKILPSRWNDDRRDPFLWLDSRNVLILIDEFTRLLIDADPVRTHLYRRNRKQILAQAARLDREFEYGYRGLQGGRVLLYYDTLQYFEQAYALKVGAVLSESPLQPVDTARLLTDRARLKEGDFNCILTEAGLPAERLSLLTDGLDVRTGELDSFATHLEAGPQLYSQLMNYTSRVIKQCLGAATDQASKTLATANTAGTPPGPPGGRFLLMDQNGNLVSDQDLHGKYQLIYFGYTFCPDVCPTSLQTMSLALERLGDQAELIQPYFITIDPERDTVAVMKNYVSYFSDRLIGLTGSREMIDRVAAAYRVKYARVPDQGGDPELYLMDHSASVYLIGPDGRFLTKFAHGISPQQMADGLRQYLTTTAVDRN